MSDQPTRPATNGIIIDAVYEDGVIKPTTPLDLPSGTPLRLQIDRRVTVVAQSDLPAAPARWALPSWLAAVGRFDLALLLVGLLLYALTRFVALDQFPIYFFADEAVQTLNAEELLRNGMRDFTGTLLPPYFLNVDKWSLGLTVYVQALGVALFGKSLVVTRAMSALVSLLAVVAVTLMLRLVLRARFWWAGALVLTALPVWFFHSRTAFETVMMVAFYGCFLCCYLLYRYRDRRYLLAAILFGGATFYSYSNGQGVMLVTLLLLLLSDWRFHWGQRHDWRLLCWAGLLVGLLALPYLRFRLLHPEAVERHLRTLNSYWIEPIPLGEKVSRFLRFYGWGLSPAYWFLPNDTDLQRHRMDNMGHLRMEFLPLALVGLWVCLREWRSSAHRLVLVALLAAPFAAALVGIGATRALAMVVPATLLIVLGLEQLFTWVSRWVSYRAFALGSALLVGLLSVAMLRGALVDGPTWFTNYGMGGMQYGAQQLFGVIAEDMERSPERRYVVSPTWANGTDLLARFFLTPQQFERLQLQSIESYTTRSVEIPRDLVMVLPPDEYAAATSDPKLRLPPPERVLPFPDGTPGFFFVRMAYSPEADAIFAAELVERQKPIIAELTLDGAPVQVTYSRLDIGEIANIFDNNPVSLMRGLEANPFVLELSFLTPRPLHEVALTVATMDFRLAVRATPTNGAPQTFTSEYTRDLNDPRVVVALPEGMGPLRTLHLEITDTSRPLGEPANIHIRELELR